MGNRRLVLLSVGAVAAVVGLGLVLSGVFTASVPADGSSCAELVARDDSESETPGEIKAWVESKREYLTQDVSVDLVAEQVNFLCIDAYLFSTRQDFTIELLETAEELAWEKNKPIEFTPEAKEWLREGSADEEGTDSDEYQYRPRNEYWDLP